MRSFVKPGFFEIYFGPMKSGKTRELINRVDVLSYLRHCDFMFFMPSRNKRDYHVSSRYHELKIECVFVESPFDVLGAVENAERTVKPNLKLVGFDEAQFFDEGIERVVQELLLRDKNVIAAGLNLDFRGEPFGRMPYLLSLADEFHPLVAVCEYPGCGQPATRTQRLIDGRPAHYNAPVVSVEGAVSSEKYEARCLRHHIVPGRPF